MEEGGYGRGGKVGAEGGRDLFEGYEAVEGGVGAGGGGEELGEGGGEREELGLGRDIDGVGDAEYGLVPEILADAGEVGEDGDAEVFQGGAGADSYYTEAISALLLRTWGESLPEIISN